MITVEKLFEVPVSGGGYSLKNGLLVCAALKIPFYAFLALKDPPLQTFSVPQDPIFAEITNWKICTLKFQNLGKIKFVSLKFGHISVLRAVN